jgi:hypothetical protein
MRSLLPGIINEKSAKFSGKPRSVLAREDNGFVSFVLFGFGGSILSASTTHRALFFFFFFLLFALLACCSFPF